MEHYIHNINAGTIQTNNKTELAWLREVHNMPKATLKELQAHIQKLEAPAPTSKELALDVLTRFTRQDTNVLHDLKENSIDTYVSSEDALKALIAYIIG